jgi:uncharacterized protein YkwD
MTGVITMGLLSRLIDAVLGRPTASVPMSAAADALDHNADFVLWLNGIRAARGLGPVRVDPEMIAISRENSRLQANRGLVGHYVIGSARLQAAAPGPYEGIGAMWMGSPKHRPYLLYPAATRMGLAGVCDFWTLSLA